MISRDALGCKVSCLLVVFCLHLCLVDSSCQINPRYVRAVLSHSPAFSNEAVLEAVLDEASCLSTTHEGKNTSKIHPQ